MKIWAPLVIIFFHMATFCAAGSEGVYPFKGRADLLEGTFDLSLKTQEGQAHLQVDRDTDGSYRSLLELENIHTPFFDMTTQLQGVVRREKDISGENVVSGRLESQHTVFNGHAGSEFSLSFDADRNVIRLTELAASGVKATGEFSLLPPYPLKARIDFYDVDVTYLLDGLAGRDKQWAGEGEISGDIQLSGVLAKLSLQADLVSRNGSIEDLPYDLLALSLQGIYPIVDLANSTVTKTNGFTFELGGTIDLSDRPNMAAQIKAIKKIPLIKDSILQSEWVLKKVEDADGEGKAETQFFLKNDKQRALSGQDDSSLLGVQKKIGF